MTIVFPLTKKAHIISFDDFNSINITKMFNSSIKACNITSFAILKNVLNIKLFDGNKINQTYIEIDNSGGFKTQFDVYSFV